MIKIDHKITLENIKPHLVNFWELSGEKIRSIQKDYDFRKGAPVITRDGKYMPRNWTEWTLGFYYGSAILNYEITGDADLLTIARDGILLKMPVHISHTGVHDHGFNIISTYGNLLRLMNEGKIDENEWERNYYELALKISGAVQASRWTETNNGGFIFSFNGSHSLFIDTIRTVRILIVSHLLGHVLKDENDVSVSLLQRALEHLKTTLHYSVYYGKGKDRYDLPGRVAHESIFNVKNGSYRGPGSHQGYSGRSTWMRGLAWAILGITEELELFEYLSVNKIISSQETEEMRELLTAAAHVTCEFYLNNTPTDGIPYWDSGAPDLNKIGKYLDQPADPYNEYEPVDSSAAVIAAQGFLRFGKFLDDKKTKSEHTDYFKAGLTIIRTLLSETYLSADIRHQGLILHSLYHYPNGWDYHPEKNKVPYGESGMWGDYHARELMMFLDKLINPGTYYTFFNCIR